MKKEDPIRKLKRSITLPLKVIHLIVWIVLLLSPLLWIWVDWRLFLRVLLSCIVISLCLKLIIKAIDEAITEVVYKEFDSKPETSNSKKSGFAERLEQARKRQEQGWQKE